MTDPFKQAITAGGADTGVALIRARLADGASGSTRCWGSKLFPVWSVVRGTIDADVGESE